MKFLFRYRAGFLKQKVRRRMLAIYPIYAIYLLALCHVEFSFLKLCSSLSPSDGRRTFSWSSTFLFQKEGSSAVFDFRKFQGRKLRRSFIKWGIIWFFFLLFRFCGNIFIISGLVFRFCGNAFPLPECPFFRFRNFFRNIKHKRCSFFRSLCSKSSKIRHFSLKSQKSSKEF